MNCLLFKFIILPVIRPDMVVVIGDMIVTVGDSDKHVNIYSKKLWRKIRSFKLEKKGGKEPCPRGVSTDGKYLFISDKAYKSITKYTIEGEKKAQTLNFDGCCGIAIDKEEKRVYVAHQSAHKIEVLGLDLKSVSLEFGEEGDQKKQFKQPRDVAVARVDGTVYVYVSDTGNNRIQVFKADGEYVTEFGNTGDDKLSAPAGICVDHDNRVLVVDHNNHRVCIFNSGGELLKSFGKNEEIKADFKDLIGIAVGRDGKIYTTDYAGNSLQVFEH